MPLGSRFLLHKYATQLIGVSGDLLQPSRDLAGVSRYGVYDGFQRFPQQGPAGFPLRRPLVHVFSQVGDGLDAEVRRVEIWCQPGDVICGSEGSYLAGQLVGSRSSSNNLAALADMTAAVGLCLASFVPEMV